MIARHPSNELAEANANVKPAILTDAATHISDPPTAVRLLVCLVRRCIVLLYDGTLPLYELAVTEALNFIPALAERNYNGLVTSPLRRAVQAGQVGYPER
jgi:hypothetical protein